MRNSARENKVEKELSEWLTREQRFQKLFSFSLDNNRAFLREKLRYYRSIGAKHKARASREERLTLRMMRQEERAIEKQLYPDLWVRLTYRALSTMVQGATAFRDQRRHTANMEELKEFIRELGFPDVALPKLQQGNTPKISIPVSYEVGEKEQMAFDLTIGRGGKGVYRLEGYTATLNREGGTPGKIKQYFRADQENTISARQSYNLLSGRPVMTGTGENRHWMQLDFNDKDTHGNYRVKRFYSGYGFDLEKKLRQLPLRELRNPEETRQLLKALQNGERTEVILIQGNKQRRVSMKANPRFKSLNLYDHRGKKISFGQAMNGKIRKKAGLRNKVRLRKGLGGKDRIRVKRT